MPGIPPKLKDPFHDTDSSLESSSSSYPTKYSSSSDWKINSESNFSLSTKKNVVLKKFQNSEVKITIQLKNNISRKYKKRSIKQGTLKRAVQKNPYVLIMDQK